MKAQEEEITEFEDVTNAPVEEGAEATEEVKEVAKPVSLMKLTGGLIIPDEFKINGVTVSEKKIQAEIDKLEKLQIKGVHDKKGLKAVEDAKKGIAKLRTTSKTWREDTARPITTAMNSFKAKIDAFGELCKTGEQIADDKMKPILDEIERLENAEETRKDDLLKERLALLVANGGKSIDGVQFEFDFNPNIFFNSALLRDSTDEEWEAEFAILTESYQAHVEAVQAAEDAKAAKETQLTELELALQAKTVKLREKELKLSGFTFIEEIGTWAQDHVNIDQDQIKSLSDDEWDALISGEESTEKQEITETEDRSEPIPYSSSGPSIHSSTSIADEFNEEPNFDEEVEGFEDEVSDVEFENEQPTEVDASVDNSILTRAFVFSEHKPFIEYPIGDKFVSRIYPNEYQDKAQDGVVTNMIRYSGKVNEQLEFILIQVV